MTATIYLTNAASRRPPYRGPGRVWTIMAAPREHFGEAGEGPVPMLVPQLRWVQLAKSGAWPLRLYREVYEMAVRSSHDVFGLGPGDLKARPFAGPPAIFAPVGDGDTLLCCCSREAAARGECHRAWAALALKDAGWNVVLDGTPL